MPETLKDIIGIKTQLIIGETDRSGKVIHSWDNPVIEGRVKSKGLDTSINYWFKPSNRSKKVITLRTIGKKYRAFVIDSVVYMDKERHPDYITSNKTRKY